jgi:hypothetical protein
VSSAALCSDQLAVGGNRTAIAPDWSDDAYRLQTLRPAPHQLDRVGKTGKKGPPALIRFR